MHFSVCCVFYWVNCHQHLLDLINSLKMERNKQRPTPKAIYAYKNTKLNPLKRKVAVWSNEMCRSNHPTPKYVNIPVTGNKQQSTNTKKIYVGENLVSKMGHKHWSAFCWLCIMYNVNMFLCTVWRLWGSGGKAPLLNLSIKWRWVVSFTHPAALPPVPI